MLLAASAIVAFGQDTAPLADLPETEPSAPSAVDRSQYSIFNPTPRALWRPRGDDRPDFIESPYTVDAGAIQIEASFLDHARDGFGDIHFRIKMNPRGNKSGDTAFAIMPVM